MAQHELRIRPAHPLQGSVTPPGAKSGTVRAVLSATLAQGTSTVVNAGSGDNIRAMVRACEQFGARVANVAAGVWAIDGVGHQLPESCELDAGNSGIVLRLLGAIGASMQRCVVGTSCPESLGRRGNQELIDALRQYGAECSGQGDTATPPLIVGRGRGLHGGRITVSSRRSSQFLSGLLFLSPLVGEDVELLVADELRSAPMIQITLDTLSRAGISVDVDAAYLNYRVRGGQRYQPGTYHVASDASSIAGILAAVAAVPESEVQITGFMGNDQGTAAMIEALGAMGASITRAGEVLVCRGAQTLRPITLDGSACPDSILPLAALACFAEGTSTFSNVETLRFKECDRISDFRHELMTAGADVDERRDAIIVHGHGSVKGGTAVYGRHDHSVVMALAALALRSELGLTIRGWDSVAQTYRTFFDDLRALGADIATVEPALTS
jgi:3-phosphoshikimate 1-carboxyvinyltransferase